MTTAADARPSPCATASSRPAKSLLASILPLAGAFLAGLTLVVGLAGCCTALPPKPAVPHLGTPPNCYGTGGRIKQQFDENMSYEGRERICLYNLERILDAKQEWARETGAGPGSLSPSDTVLAHHYFRKYQYGRRLPCDDDTQELPVLTARCPSGGEYIIGTVGERPKCTKHGDLLRDYDLHVRVKHTH